MFAVDVCLLPATGGTTGIAVAALVLLVLGAVVARWVRASAGRLSVVATVPILLMALVGASAPSVECSQVVLAPTTSVAPTTTTSVAPTTTTTSVAPTTTTTVVPTTTTTVVPVDPNLVLQIDTSLLPPPEFGGASMSTLDAGFVYELGLFGDVDVHVDWGDSFSDDLTDAGPFAHTYAESGEYTITVSGTLTGFGQSPYSNPLVGAEYLVGVSSFGDLGLTSLDFAFWSANNLVSVPSVLPSSVVSLEDTFWAATLFNDDISSWDTANVTNMTWMFEEAASFNGDISGWDTSNVTNMSYMFSDASAFNQPLNLWKTSSVTDMNGMFEYASVFNQSLSSWDTSNVTYMSYMFSFASAFDQPIGDWKVSLVTNMSNMFNNSGLSNGNYALTLIGWASQNVKEGVNLGAQGKSVGNSPVSASCIAWSDLDESWNINDASQCGT